jgi:hypothetical protein
VEVKLRMNAGWLTAGGKAVPIFTPSSVIVLVVFHVHPAEFLSENVACFHATPPHLPARDGKHCKSVLIFQLAQLSHKSVTPLTFPEAGVLLM